MEFFLRTFFLNFFHGISFFLFLLYLFSTFNCRSSYDYYLSRDQQYHTRGSIVCVLMFDKRAFHEELNIIWFFNIFQRRARILISFTRLVRFRFQFKNAPQLNLFLLQNPRHILIAEHIGKLPRDLIAESKIDYRFSRFYLYLHSIETGRFSRAYPCLVLRFIVLKQ